MTASTEAREAVAAPEPIGRLPLPASGLATEQEREQRKRDLALSFRVFGRLGFSESVAGHITARDPEHLDSFWVNPFGKSFNRIRVSDLIRVDHLGQVVEGDRAVNLAAFCIHSEVHKARPDVVAAAHSHSVYGKAFSSLGLPLDPITQDACAFYDDHAVYTDYNGVVSDSEEGRQIGLALGPNKAVILQNHGLLTVGASVFEAAWYFVTMERSCQAQLAAMAAGTPKLIPDAVARQVRDQISGPLPGWFQFQPLVEQITESDPDVFT